ncbi:pogo transposable element with ZNF domain [Caerostris extrusa]|uniref:Pogo transposable element with ZNF domain n=1 Tax=Caerostris extrusa TaxID=172846 RepID=A0AAV4Y2T2_CAEEX|nr:pogo transposable element with ZNF domain [Caerostris extrusa]
MGLSGTEVIGAVLMITMGIGEAPGPSETEVRHVPSHLPAWRLWSMPNASARVLLPKSTTFVWKGYEDNSATGTPERNVDDDAEDGKEVIEEKRQQVSQELEMLYNEESDASDKFEPEPEAEVLEDQKWCSLLILNTVLCSLQQGKPLTEHTCLMLETSLFQVDREEQQMASLRGGQCKGTKVQELIDCSRTLDASPSTSDRED